MSGKTVTVNGKDVTFNKFIIKPTGKDTGTVSTEYVIKDSSGSGPIDTKSVKMNVKNLTLEITKSDTLNVTIDPVTNTVTFKSDNTSVATVDPSTGKVTGIKAGTAQITATSMDTDVAKQKSDTCVVTVTDPAPIPVTGISTTTPKFSVQLGETEQFNIAVEPDTATDKTVTYKSSDDTIATVDAAGVITGMSLGDATITATTTNGGKTVDCIVTVTFVSININLKKIAGKDTYYLPFIDNNVVNATKSQSILGTIEDITFTPIDDANYQVYALSSRINHNGHDYSYGLLAKNSGTFSLDILRAGIKIGQYNVTIPTLGGSRSTHKNRKSRYTRKASSRKTRKH